MKHGIKAAALAALVGAVLAAGCGSGSSPSSTSATTRTTSAVHTSSPSKRPAPARRSAKPLAPVGQSQRVSASDATLTVTVSRVIDPLRGSGAALLPGSRAVGVLLRVVNHGPGIYDSSATGDVSIAISSGTATPVFAQAGVCQTPLRDFDNYISPAEQRQGCVAFSLPSGARVLAVRFSPHAKATGRVSWAIS